MEFMWKPKFESLKGTEQVSANPGLFTHITHELYQGGCGIDLYVYQSDYTYMESLFKTKTANL